MLHGERESRVPHDSGGSKAVKLFAASFLAITLLPTAASAIPSATFEVDSIERPGCEHVTEEICPATHEEGTSGALGDDTIYADFHVQRVSARADAGAGPELAAGYDLADATIEHGLGPPAKEQFDEFYVTYPDEAEAWLGVWVEHNGFVFRRPDVDPETGQPEPLYAMFPWGPLFNSTHARLPYTTNITPMNDLDYYLLLVSCSATTTIHSTCQSLGYFEIQELAVDSLPNVVVNAEVREVAAAVNPIEERTSSVSTGVSGNPTRQLREEAVGTDGVALPASARADRRPTVPDELRPVGPGRVAFLAPSSEPASMTIPRAPSPAWWPLAAAPALTLLLFLFLALFHRIRKDRALANPTRARIFEAIAAEPGVRVWTLATRLGLDPSTVDHHVGMLRKLHLVEAVEGGQRRLFVNGGTFGADQKRLFLATSAPSVAAVLALVRGRRIVDFSDLQAALQMRPSTASEAVRALEAVGLVVKRREGGRLRVEATGS